MCCIGVAWPKICRRLPINLMRSFFPTTTIPILIWAMAGSTGMIMERIAHGGIFISSNRVIPMWMWLEDRYVCGVSWPTCVTGTRRYGFGAVCLLRGCGTVRSIWKVGSKISLGGWWGIRGGWEHAGWRRVWWACSCVRRTLKFVSDWTLIPQTIIINYCRYIDYFIKYIKAKFTSHHKIATAVIDLIDNPLQVLLLPVRPIVVSWIHINIQHRKA